MAYDNTKLSLMFSQYDGAWNFWVYRSADAIATVRAANYISNAQAVGMKVRDMVLVLDTNVPTTQFCTVLTVGASGADLTDGTAVAETNS